MVRNPKGFILITSYMLIVLLVILGNAFLLTTTAHSRHVFANRKSTQAFSLAEAGVDAAIYQIKTGTSEGSDVPGYPSGEDQEDPERSYLMTWSETETEDVWSIESTGKVNGAPDRKILVTVQKIAAPSLNITNKALYVAGDLTVNGNAYDITGDVILGGEQNIQHDKVDGTVLQDSSINPMFDIDLQELRSIAEEQGNLYDASTILTAEEPYFYHNNDSENGINIIYVEGDLDLNAPFYLNGFVIVAGDVANGDNIGDMTLSGNGTLNGVLYGKGGLKLSGNVTINGSLLVGGQGENGSTELETTISGSIELNYTQTYVNAVYDLIQPEDTYDIVEWEEI